MNRIFLILLVVLSLSIPTAVFGWSNWQAYKTKHFTLFFQPGYEQQGWEAIQTLEHYRSHIENLTTNQTLHLPVVLDDVGREVNAWADPFWYNMHLYPTAPGRGQLLFVENWWSLACVHEYTHILHMTNTGDIPGGLRTVFGNIFCPNIYSPGWLTEGIAVYSESNISPMQGRLNDGYFDAFIGASVYGNRLPSIHKATSTPLEVPLDGYYIYGSEFCDYLTRKYGRQQLTRFIDVNGSTFWSLFSAPLPFIGIDRTAMRVYGKSMPKLWEEWLQHERKRFSEYEPEGERLTWHGWRTEDPVLHEGKIYYKRTYPVKTGAFRRFVFNEIIEYDITNGHKRRIISTTAPLVLKLKVAGQKLYYGTLEVKPGYGNSSMLTYGTYVVLRERDLISGKDRSVLSGDIRAYSPLAGGDILYSVDRKNGFGSELYRYNVDLGQSSFLFDTGCLVNEIEVDRERIIVSARRDWENFSLYKLSLPEAEFSPVVQTPYFEGNAFLSDDELFFTANYGKVHSAYCYSFKDDRVYRLTEKGYADCPVFDGQSKLLYFVGLNSYGSDLYVKKGEFVPYQVVQSFSSEPPEFTLQQSDVSLGTYRDNLKTMLPGLRFPMLYMDEDSFIIGFLLMGRDAIGDFPAYISILQLDLLNNRSGIALNLQANYFAPLQASIYYNDLDERDLVIYLQYPLWKRLSPGLSTVSVNMEVSGENDFKRTVFGPGLSTGFNYPRTKASLGFNTYIGRKSMSSIVDRTGFYTTAELTRYINHSELDIGVAHIYDPDNPKKVFPSLRGYSGSLSAKKGFVLSVDFSVPLFEIRRGLWNPNIYWEDVCATLFWDDAIPDKRYSERRQCAGGVEFHLETKLFFNGIPADLGVRLSRNRENDSRIVFFLKID